MYICTCNTYIYIYRTVIYVYTQTTPTSHSPRCVFTMALGLKARLAASQAELGTAGRTTRRTLESEVDVPSWGMLGVNPLIHGKTSRTILLGETRGKSLEIWKTRHFDRGK